jgi:NTP pyrophosphatase (non-canonical NTP hydrolase)
MQFNEYQELAERTANKVIKDGVLVRYANFGMGIAGEAGEVCNYLKKVVFHGHPLNLEKLKEELGDTLWYIATIATTAGTTIEEVAIANIEKLKVRYPDGFSEEKSINRN